MQLNLEKILKLIQENPVEFARFSKDLQQPNPIARATSIACILNRISLPNSSTILDIGTGYGYGAVLLNALGYNVIGLEINSRKLEEGMRYWAKLGISFDQTLDPRQAIQTKGRLHFLSGDSRRLEKFQDNSIDMITAFYISGYMLGKRGAFNEASRILKSGGNLTMTTEGYSRLPMFLRRITTMMAFKLFTPQGLQLRETLTLENPKVYDRFTATYSK